jgi:hypothetical protein
LAGATLVTTSLVDTSSAAVTVVVAKGLGKAVAGPCEANPSTTSGLIRHRCCRISPVKSKYKPLHSIQLLKILFWIVSTCLIF